MVKPNYLQTWHYSFLEVITSGHKKPCVLLLRAQKLTDTSLKPSFALKIQRWKSVPFICNWNLARLTPLCL